jgi:DNA end-binding protein Ku
VLHTLRWLEEIRDRGDLTSSAPVTDRELQLAEVLMDALAGVDIGGLRGE